MDIRDDIRRVRCLARYCLVAVCLTALANEAAAHGAVVVEDDVCTLRIGFFEAQLKLYQPRVRGHEQFCEAVPDAAETVFVMEYQHGPLSEAPIGLRIMRDVTGRGAYARLEDIDAAGGVEDATVFHRPEAVARDVFSVVHEFDEPGWYLGIVTVEHPTLDREYRTVFPFEVGYTGLGQWPLFAVIALAAQLHYWYARGHLSRWRAKWLAPRTAAQRASARARAAAQ